MLIQPDGSEGEAFPLSGSNTLIGRGTGGQGRAFTTCVQGRLGLLELEDVVRAVKEIAKRSYVDPGRVGIWGWSYGGTMACNALTMRSDVFRAGVAVAPVTDWRLYDTIYTERYMGLPSDNRDGYRNSAPLNFAAGLEGRLLICHGTMDNNVHLQNTLMMAEEYVKAGKLFDMMVYPRVRHGTRVSHHRHHFHRLKTEFLQRHLIQDGPR